MTGAILGTPGYMAPEQARGRQEDIGPATDIFALGVMLYETLTGRRPFQGSTIVQTIEFICLAEPVPLRGLQPNLPRDLDIICLKCLEKLPRRRYASAAELADDLERWLAGKPILARPVAAWEHGWKWLRRHPAWGALIAVSAMAVTSLVVGVLWHNRQLQAEVPAALANISEMHWDQAEADLRRIVVRLEALLAVEPSLPLIRSLANAHFAWAELEIARNELPQTLKRYDQNIVMLERILTVEPEDNAALTAVSNRYRLKAWHLSRAGPTDAAFVAWDRAIQRATPADLPFLRTERALERALLGDHTSAAIEADEVAGKADLSEFTTLHLARVYTCSLQALERDHLLSGADRKQLAESYAERAVSCLRRITPVYSADVKLLQEVEADTRFDLLRESAAFRAWRIAKLPTAFPTNHVSGQALGSSTF